MTLQEKKRKLGIINAIILVLFVKAMKSPPKTVQEALELSFDAVFWSREFHLVSKHPVFEPGGIIHSKNNEEFVISKNGEKYKLPRL
jgi:hypothetical protein